MGRTNERDAEQRSRRETGSGKVSVADLPVFWEIALEGERAAAEAEGRGLPYAHTSGTLTAIVFAAVTVEAYPAHLMAEVTAGLPWCSEVDRTLLERVLKRQRKRRRRIEKCYARATPNRQKELPWFKRTACLRELRNDLVRFAVTPPESGRRPHRLLDRRCRGIMDGWQDGPAYHWTSQVLRAGVAHWACQTARMAIEALHSFVGGPSPWDASVPDRVPLRDSV